MKQKEFALGIDIGGTKIAFALVDRQGQVEALYTSPSQSQDAEALFQSVLSGIHHVLKTSQRDLSELAGIGIGLPGKVDHEHGVAIFQNNIPWPNFPIVQRLRDSLAIDCPIAIDNDVKVAAYAEYHAEAMTKDELFTYVTISTGIANASIINHQMIRGSGFSGETGFLPIAQGDKIEKLESIVGGPAIEKAGRLAFNDASITSREVFERYLAGDEKAVIIIENCAKSFALGLYAMICVLDPAHITLGGSVAYHNPSFVALIKEHLSKLLHEEQAHILKRLSVSTIGGNNGVIGAGLLAFNHTI